MTTGWRQPALKRLDRDVAPLSFAQERLWFVDAASPGSVTYNVPLLIRWCGRVNVSALAAALAALARRQAVLRTTYRLQDGRPVQVVHPPRRPSVEVVDVDEESGAPNRVRAEACRHARRPFDLSAVPPLRVVVWRGAPSGDWVLLCIHHIAIDGWSLAALFEDLAEAYRQALTGSAPMLPSLPVQYADFAHWEREAGRAPQAERDVNARLDELLAVPAGVPLGLGGPRPRAPEGARPGVEHAQPLPAPVWTGVASLAASVHATPFVVLFAAFQVVLQRWSGREELLVGVITANRAHRQLESVVGFFVNTVPVVCRIPPELSFRQLCHQVRVSAFRALNHQRIPYDRLTAAAATRRRDRDRTPLVDIGFALQNTPAPRLPEPPPWGPVELLHTATAKFDLTLIVVDGPDGPTITAEHATDRYPVDLGRRVTDTYLALLAAAVTDPDLLVPRLPVGPPGRTPASVLIGARRDPVAERMALLTTATSEEPR